MATVEQILQEPDNYSELSIDASFTLQDILQQPPDQEIDAFQNLQEIQNFDAFFEDQDQPSSELKTQKTSSKEENVSPTMLKKQEDPNPTSQPLASEPIEPLTQSKPLQRWARLSNLPMPCPQKIRNMVYITLKNVTQLFDINKSQTKGVGIPTCISSSGNKFLAIGTSIGNIVIFEVGVKGNRILSTPDQSKYGQTTSISISRDNRYIVAGYETGLVILWDLYSFKVVKTVLLQKNKILKVLFCSQNFQNFVSSDSQGYIYMYTIENYLWTGIKTQLLIDKSENIYHDIKYSKVKSGRQILALSTLNSILLVIMKPTVAILGSIEKPQGISTNKIPNCEIGEGQQRKIQKFRQNEGDKQKQKEDMDKFKGKQDYVCVSWGRFIYVYTLAYSNSQIEKIQLNFIAEQPSGVHNMELITSGILVTIDNRQVYRVINLQSERQKLRDGSKKTMGSNINTSQLESETIYQRHLKDKQGKYIKSYSNTIVSCSYNPRYKQIFLISKNAVYRGRLQKWTDYIHYLLTQSQNWQLALKLCIQLYKGNINIFAQPFILNKTTINLLCDIGRIFFNERMKQIQGKRTQLNSIDEVKKQVEELFQIVIQYFCVIGCEDYMFQAIYKKIKDLFFFMYRELFVVCLEPFIQKSMITKIPTRDIFVTIVDQYAGKPQLLNKFIMGLHKDFIYFEDIVQICTRQKLFESLSYICSINNDFISPANKLISYLQTASQSSPHYQTLKTYLQNLLQFEYPNGKPITNDKQKKKMLSDLQIWLVCDQTLQYMAEHYSNDYVEMLKKLGDRLLQYEMINQIPMLAEQVINKMQLIKKKKLLPAFVQLLMGLGLSYKIHFSQELIKNILNAAIEVYTTYNSAELHKQFKYNYMLKFLEKYLLDKHGNVKVLRDQFEQKLIPKLNIWVRMTYKMLAGQSREQLLKQSPQLLKNQDPGRDASIGYLFQNATHYSEIIQNYEDLLVQWSPQLSLMYMIQTKQGRGIHEINSNVMKIQDQKLRYAVLRKILRLVRQKSRESPTHSTQLTQILRASITQLHNPSLDSLTLQLESNISNEILVFYMKCICKYKKQKRVFYELIQNEEQYRNVVHQLQSIIKQYGYHSCLGFIYEQQLKLREAFDQYQIVYRQFFQENFRKLVMHEHCHGRFMARMFHIMLNLCFRINKQQQWGLLISCVLSPLQSPDFTSRPQKLRIIDTIQTIYTKKSSKQHPFIQQLIDVIQLTLTNMSRQVSIYLMAIQLNKYTDLLNKSFIVNCLSSTLKGCNKRVQTYQISRKLMIDQFVREWEIFYEVNKIKGAVTDDVCDQCGLEASSRIYNANIEEIRFEVLKCGHSYHKTCYQKNYYKCKVCNHKAYGDTCQTQEENKNKDKLSILLRKQDMNNSGQKMEIKQIIRQSDSNTNSNEIYRYLALDDYRKREEQNFQAFVELYQGYIDAYKNL